MIQNSFKKRFLNNYNISIDIEAIQELIDIPDYIPTHISGEILLEYLNIYKKPYDRDMIIKYISKIRNSWNDNYLVPLLCYYEDLKGYPYTSQSSEEYLRDIESMRVNKINSLLKN